MATRDHVSVGTVVLLAVTALAGAGLVVGPVVAQETTDGRMAAE